jgi:SAM-dependent methyltransferase
MPQDMSHDILVPATAAAFDEESYLAANPDVRAAVATGKLRSGRHHFDAHGCREGRRMMDVSTLAAMRASKMERLRPHLRTDMAHQWREGKADYLSAELRASAGIVDTAAVSSNGYDGNVMAIIDRYPDGLVLDCGAGSRPTYYGNVVNYEIVDYLSTDVLGIGEELPFEDGTFDAVISVAVLEHVRDPFRCAQEIARVLRPGGELFCAVPFLQPYHGYPHHYFNATEQGIRRLFEDSLQIERVHVNEATHPIHALQWILASWSAGLEGRTRKRFKAMTVAELCKAPMEQVMEAYCRELPEAKQLELACATILTARKPG